MMADEDAVKVHVIQDDTKTAKTEEVEPEHFTATSFTLPALGLTSGNQADYNAEDPVQILQLDPLRKEAVISFNGSGQVFLAHSAAQAISLQNATQQGADSGDLITCPTTIRVEGTGPLWAVASNISSTPNGGSSLYVGGSATPATAFLIVDTVNITPPAGTYVVSGLVYVDGTVVTADDEDNMRLMIIGGTPPIAPIIYPAESSGVPIVTPYGPFTLTLNGSQELAIQTFSKTPSGTAVYHASILLNPVANSIPNGLIVGVLQERRGA
jgi:hypothetical protein